MNDIKSNYHGFVFNVGNAPFPSAYGFLDVMYFSGALFSPSSKGVILQKFYIWNTGKVYTRCYASNYDNDPVWTPWISPLYESEN